MVKKRVLITGKNGQLVTDIVRRFSYELDNYELFAFGRDELDVTNKNLLKEAIENIEPNIFIQGASYHVVEAIEDNIEYATKVNIDSLHTAAKICGKIKCRLINFSTNYVYGNKDYMSDKFFHYGSVNGFNEEWLPNPCNVYGLLKRTGEQIVEAYCEDHWNFRVAGLFGKTGSRSKNGDNFPYRILADLAEDKEVKVVDDQIMNVSYTVDIAEAIVDALNKGNLRNGIHHLTNSGSLTWFEFAKFISEYKYGNSNAIVPCKTSDFYSSIERPLLSALKSAYFQLPSWQSGFVRFMKEIEED